MRVSVEQLRVTVETVSDFVGRAYQQLDPPFNEEMLAFHLAALPGVVPALSDRLAALYSTISDKRGDGGKSAVLIATRVVAELLRPGMESGIADVVASASARVAAWVESDHPGPFLLESPEQLGRVASAAAGGNVALSSAIVNALCEAGKDGTIHVEVAPPDEPPGVRSVLEQVDGVPAVTMFVRGDTTRETETLYSRLCNTLHSTVRAVASGVVGGGGAAYVVAEETLIPQSQANSILGRVAGALASGLEVPLRLRAKSTGLEFTNLHAQLRADPGLAFDLTVPGLVSARESGPLDAVGIVSAVIENAGVTAGELLNAL